MCRKINELSLLVKCFNSSSKLATCQQWFGFMMVNMVPCIKRRRRLVVVVFIVCVFQHCSNLQLSNCGTLTQLENSKTLWFLIGNITIYLLRREFTKNICKQIWLVPFSWPNNGSHKVSYLLMYIVSRGF